LPAGFGTFRAFGVFGKRFQLSFDVLIGAKGQTFIDIDLLNGFSIGVTSLSRVHSMIPLP